MGSDLRGRCERRVSGDERAEKRCRPAQPRSVKRLAQKQSRIDRQKKAAQARAMGSNLRAPGNGASAATSARNNVPDLHSNVASTDWRKKSQASAGKERLHARAACVQTSCGPENVAPTDSTRGKKLKRFTAAVCSWRRRRNSAAARRPPASRPSPSRRLNREARFAIFHKFWTTSPRDRKMRVVSFFC